MTHIAFIVPAQAAPQGSKRHVGKGVMIEQSKRVKPYRQAVETAARGCKITGIDHAVNVYLAFYFTRPKSAKGRRFPHRGGPGDIDKLIRATLDGITTSKLWTDDSLVVHVDAWKFYLEDHSTTGPYVSVRITPAL